MSKFIVGQRLRCIRNDNARPNQEGTSEGAGWKNGFEFIPYKITSNDRIPIYWPTGGTIGGIYEDYLEDATPEWDGRKNVC